MKCGGGCRYTRLGRFQFRLVTNRKGREAKEPIKRPHGHPYSRNSRCFYPDCLCGFLGDFAMRTLMVFVISSLSYGALGAHAKKPIHVPLSAVKASHGRHNYMLC